MVLIQRQNRSEHPVVSEPASKKRRLKRWVIIAVVCVLVIAVAGKLLARPKGRMPVDSVYQTAQVERRDINSSITGSGTLAAANSYSVTSLVGGSILSDTFEEGDQVNAGQTVATIRDASVMKLTVPFPSDDAAGFYVGQSAQIMLAGTFETLSGTVMEVSAADTVLTGNMLVRSVTIEVANPGGLSTTQTATAAVGDSTSTDSGTFTYREERTVTAEVSGKVSALSTAEGRMISSRLAIAVLDSSDMDNAVQSAYESLRNAQLSLENQAKQLEDYTIYYTVTSMAEMLETMTSMIRILVVVLTGIAAISLVVGGIGFLSGALPMCDRGGAVSTDRAVEATRTLGIPPKDAELSSRVTRAQLAVMLTASSTYKDSIGTGGGSSLYKDVKKDHWASEYIKLAIQRGWMFGYVDGTFRPEQNVTLEEACAILFYNLLISRNNSGTVYGTTLGYTVTNGQIDYSTLVNSDAKGPYVAEQNGVVTSSRKAASTSTTSNTSAAAQSQTEVACTDGVTRTFYTNVGPYTVGRVVSVAVNGSGTTIKTIQPRRLSGTVSRDGATLAGYRFAENVEILDTDSEGGYARIYPSRLANAQLKDENVLGYTLDSQGQIDHLFLRNATGDTYKYVYITSAEKQSEGMNLSSSYSYLQNGQSQSYQSNTTIFPVNAGGARLIYDGGTLKSMRQLNSVKLSSLGSLDAMGDGKKYLLDENVQVILRSNGYYPTTLLEINGEDYKLTGWYDTL